MTPKWQPPPTPRIEEAIGELQALIASCYPEAVFTVSEGEDPDGIYLTATVDLEDIGEVVEVFLDHMVKIQIEEELPIFVVAVRPLARNRAILAQQQNQFAVLNSLG